MKNIFGPSYTMFLKIYLPLLAIFGFFGNLMVCIIFCSTTIHQSSMNSLIVNLAIADMLQCVNLLFMVTGVNDLTWFTNNALCQLDGIATTVFVGTSTLSLMLIGINRYFIITKKSAKNIFTRQNTLIFILFVWLYPLAISIGPLIGWSKYVYLPSALICTVNAEYDVSYQAVNFSTMMAIPLLILCFCTWKILMTVKRTRLRVTEAISSRSEQHKTERHVTLMLLVVIITFFIFYAPAFIAITITALKYKVKLWIRNLTVMIALLNHVNNPLIYGLMNGNFRQAVLELFCRMKLRSTLRTVPFRRSSQSCNVGRTLSVAVSEQ